jgi:hypothetical protein
VITVVKVVVTIVVEIVMEIVVKLFVMIAVQIAGKITAPAAVNSCGRRPRGGAFQSARVSSAAP